MEQLIEQGKTLKLNLSSTSAQLEII